MDHFHLCPSIPSNSVWPLRTKPSHDFHGWGVVLAKLRTCTSSYCLLVWEQIHFRPFSEIIHGYWHIKVSRIGMRKRLYHTDFDLFEWCSHVALEHLPSRLSPRLFAGRRGSTSPIPVLNVSLTSTSNWTALTLSSVFCFYLSIPKCSQTAVNTSQYFLYTAGRYYNLDYQRVPLSPAATHRLLIRSTGS